MLIYNKVSIYFYILERYIYVILLSKYNFFYFFKLLSIFIAGIFTICTPCFISLLPIFLSYASYVKDNLSIKRLYFLGLLSSLMLIIIPVYVSGNKFLNIFTKLPIISAICFIFISLNLLDILQISFIFENFIFSKNERYNYLQYYLVGLSIGLSCLPCNASIILTTILWFSNHSTLWQSIFFLIIYVIGCLFPFLIIFYIPINFNKLDNFIRVWTQIVPLGGLIMLSFGFFILFQNL
uniref:Thiol:disulfide interchange protein n=1 Tax=Centroceras clavulatum TaxID=159503 RepID=A0A4D6WNT8_9FLOR|nr:Thiol:disulfide interchange protein [Centroceras clavulatum]